MALRHRLRGPADHLAREPARGEALPAADLPARGTRDRRAGGNRDRPRRVDLARTRGHRAGGPPDAGAAPRGPPWAARPEALRERGRGLARGRGGLAVVRPLPLPGDRAPRDRRRELPEDVLALP